MSQRRVSQNNDVDANLANADNASLVDAALQSQSPKPVNGSAGKPPKTNGGMVSLGGDEDDIRRYRADQNYSLHVAAKKKAVVVPVARPDRQTWIMVHPDPDWRAPYWLFEDKANRRVYLVEPDIAPDITDDLVLKLLVAYVSLSGAPGLWPIRLPGEGGNIDTYNESALAIVSEHAGKWIRVLCNQNEKAYSILDSPPMELPTPKWPEGGYDWMTRIAFKNRKIKAHDHPALLALRGRLSDDAR
jgi:hypothetical protein